MFDNIESVKANYNKASSGGFLYIAFTNEKSSFNAKYAEFIGNTARAGDGGVFYIEGAATILSFSNNNAVIIFSSNTAINGRGGAIYANQTTINFANASSITFKNNTAIGDSGGAIYATQSTINFSDSSSITFNNNTATNGGGAIYVNVSNSLIFNTDTVKFIGNTALGTENGGSIYMWATAIL